MKDDEIMRLLLNEPLWSPVFGSRKADELNTVVVGFNNSSGRFVPINSAKMMLESSAKPEPYEVRDDIEGNPI